MLFVNNRKREKIIFDAFKSNYRLSGEFTHGDSPDFVGQHYNSRLGVEVTEIYRSQKLHEKEVQKDRIVDRAKLSAIELGLPPLHVSVMFSDSVKNERENYLTKYLFEIVTRKCPEVGNRVDLDSSDHNLPYEFDSITIYNISGSKNHIWNVLEAGFVETNFSGQLQKIIDSKSKKVSQYLSKCDRCWLIVAALGLGVSSFYEIGKDMEEIFYETSFENVFFLEVFKGHIKQLNIRNRS